MIDFGTKFVKDHPFIKPKVQSNKGATVPPINLRPPKEIIKEQEIREAEEREEAEKIEDATPETNAENAPKQEKASDDALDLELDVLPSE